MVRLDVWSLDPRCTEPLGILSTAAVIFYFVFSLLTGAAVLINKVFPFHQYLLYHQLENFNARPCQVSSESPYEN